MGLMILKCPHCGQRNLIKENEHYRCPMCESIIFNDDYKSYEEAVEKLIHEGKEADMGVLRHSLNNELEQEHLNTENIKSICRQIKAIIPEDVIASFYLTFVERKSYPKNYESFLKQLSQEKVGKYALDQIVPVIINSCDIRVKELVEELLKAHNLYSRENKEKINRALQEREEEIERYDTEKDVFVCHSSKDKEEIVKIVNALEDNSISCWYSGRNLPRDIENYWEGIHKAVNDCRVFLFVLSKYSRMSKDVVHELDYARSLNKEIRIEYRIDESENNLPIKKCFDGIQWIDGSKQCKHEELAERIYNDLESTNKIDVEKKEVQELPKLSHDELIDYNKIEFHLNFEEYNEAIKEIKSLMMQHPNDAKLWELLLEAELEGKQEANTKVIKTFNKLLSLVDNEKKAKIESYYKFLNIDNKKTVKEEKNQKHSSEEVTTEHENITVVPESNSVKEKESNYTKISLTYTKAKEQHMMRNYETAFKLYEQGCEEGDIRCYYGIALFYDRGYYVEENKEKAKRLFVNYFDKIKDLADLGDAESSLIVYFYYLNGFGFEKNIEEGIPYLKKAAEQGNSIAQNNLGNRYLHGEGVEKNYEEAVKWYKLAAEKGHAKSQNDLGDCYYYGYGVDIDYQEAVKWYKLAAEQGDADAQNNLGNCYYCGEGVTEDYQEAVKWYKLAAEQGDAIAQYNLGYCYRYGEGVTKDYQEAVKWYKLSAEQGDAKAQYILGDCYRYGEGVTEDYQEAVKWYKLAAEQGNSRAQNNLGDCYYYGEGVTEDYQEAVKWYKLAAEQGNSIAQNNLGDCYFSGDGVTEDYQEALKWYRLSAEQGNGGAIHNLREKYKIEV